MTAPVTWPTPTPLWIVEGLSHRGLREIPGKAHNPTIINWLIKAKAWWKEDETPWCGTFVQHCLDYCAIPYPKHWYRAKAYEDYGTACDKDAIPFGAICVKSRKGGGHVFFAVAQSRDGSIIYGLGGNQSNSVNIVAFNRSEIDAVRWPITKQPRLAMPIISSIAQVGGTSRGSEA